jgi:hypothetical protein
VLMPPLCGGRDPHFVGEILQIGARFGTEGRRFKSSRPDQFSENLRKSAEFSLAVRSVFDAPIRSQDPSAPYFKRWPSEELFDIRL